MCCLHLHKFIWKEQLQTAQSRFLGPQAAHVGNGEFCAKSESTQPHIIAPNLLQLLFWKTKIQKQLPRKHASLWMPHPPPSSSALLSSFKHMSLITLPDHLLHQILLHLPAVTGFSLTHPTLHTAVTTATILSLSHPPPTVPSLNHLTLTSTALQSTHSFNNLSKLRSLTLPPLTTQLLPATKALLSNTQPTSLTLHPSPLVTSLIPYLSPTHVTAKPHHPGFLSQSLTLIHALPLKSFHLHLPQRLLPHDELVAIAKHSKANHITYQLSIPAYDYPFHTPHTEAPMTGITIGYVKMRNEALWSDIQGWNRLERLSVWGAEQGVLEKLFCLLKARIRKIRIGERDDDDFVIGKGWRARKGCKVIRGGFWSGVAQCAKKMGVLVDVVDDGGGSCRDFVTLLLWKCDT